MESHISNDATYCMKHARNIGGDGIKMLPLCIKFSLTATKIKKILHK